MNDLHGMRREYQRDPLEATDLAADPITQFRNWFDEAVVAGVAEPNAMALATAGTDGVPAVRIVLLKEIRDNGLVFFTDYRSRKSSALQVNPNVATVFHWQPLDRQVRFVGTASPLPGDQSDPYFASRPRGSQLGAWASHQSSEITDRDQLERQLAVRRAEFGDGPIARPPHWGGYLITVNAVEFWQGRPDRLHDRFLYTRTSEPGWRCVRLSP